MIHLFKESRDFTDDMTFGEFIRKKRRLMGLNQGDFAKLLGVDQSTVCAWELGERSPAIHKATTIITYLGGELLIVNRSDECLLRKERQYD